MSTENGKRILKGQIEGHIRAELARAEDIGDLATIFRSAVEKHLDDFREYGRTLLEEISSDRLNRGLRSDDGIISCALENDLMKILQLKAAIEAKVHTP